MKGTLILTAILLPVCAGVTAQDDPAALAVLDRFAGIAKSAPSVSIEFRMITSDIMENRKDTVEGKVVISGDMYRLTMPESITWFNGTDSWNYMPSVKEVTITRPSGDELSFVSKPSLLFSMYRNDFRSRIAESTLTYDVIEMIPADIKSEIIRVRLTISRKTSALMTAEYRTRNGITVTVLVNDYNLKFKPDQKYFTFNPSDYKGVEVIDMRR